jgi:hypothetical protein
MLGMSALDPGRRVLPPDTPPELVSPTSSNSSRSSPATEAAWAAPRPLASPPMSDCEKEPKPAVLAEKPADSAAVRPEMSSQPAQRQQLPSLSSLFGPPTSRPLQSPMSDRPAPLSATSPLDRPRIASASASRPHADSYFPPTLSPPLSNTRASYDIPERPSHDMSKRPGSGSGTPRSDAPNGHRWTAPHDSGRTEYGMEARDQSFRSSGSQFRLQFPANREHRHSFSESRTSSSAHNPPPTPTSSGAPDGLVTGKDGLGPKIWTGTNFLPRFVRTAQVDGEGLCYFYDDGTHCKSVIDGEAVNAHWGVTKAGKPRKRLAIACVTCREKKIKCDPDYPRCIQCEKFGRVCKFKNA